jgi:hypothetical protein
VPAEVNIPPGNRKLLTLSGNEIEVVSDKVLRISDFVSTLERVVYKGDEVELEI